MLFLHLKPLVALKPTESLWLTESSPNFLCFLQPNPNLPVQPYIQQPTSPHKHILHMTIRLHSTFLFIFLHPVHVVSSTEAYVCTLDPPSEHLTHQKEPPGVWRHIDPGWQLGSSIY